jgi:hypothetical protein
MSTKDYKPIFAGSKVIGKVQGGVFYKTIRSKHMLRVPPAIANDIGALQDAMNAGASKVCITNKDSGITYTTTMQQILNKGVKFNRGFGDQVYLMLDEWQKSGANVARQYTLFAAEVT